MNDIKEVIEMADIITNTSLTGEIKILNRKLNSEKEDIIINTIIAGADQVTEGYFNINIHIPNLKNQPSGIPNTVDNTQPNIPRMESIGAVIMEVIDGFRGFDFSLNLDSSGEVIPDGKNWYYNIVVQYIYLRRDKN